jgi:hypothetical protein
MSQYTNVKVGVALLKDGNLKDNRPAWWVIIVAVLFLMYLIMG